MTGIDRNHPETDRDRHVRSALAKVPEISIVFWALKLLTTCMGEAWSDFMGDHSVPVAAAVGLFGTILALRLQLRSKQYKAYYYWAVVAMIATFGTMTADAIHDGAGIGYDVTTPVFALFTAAVFFLWWRSEGTLDIHSITTPRRERYYWLAVFGTFALGTAAGDFTATFLNIGFGHSIELFAALMLIPAVGWWRLGWNPILTFWCAYVLTRPIGASFADWFSKAPAISGLGLGDGLVAEVTLGCFVLLVAWVTIKKIDVQPPFEMAPHPHRQARELSRLGLESD